ncbi:hypothetical protein B7486_61620, partial [cyanobacterium TDX16]
RGTSLAVATLAMALMFSSLLFTNSALTGGVRGLPIEGLSFAGMDLDPLEHPQRYGGFVLGVLLLVGLLVANLRRGRTGLRLLAVRSNERAAASLGINVVATKVYAFGVAAAIAALGGALLSLRQANVQFDQYNVFSSVLLIQYAAVGGVAWISGAIVAAIGAPGAIGALLFEKVVPEGTDIVAWLAILSAFGAVSVLRQAPDGTAALWSRAACRFTAPFQVPRWRSDPPPATARPRRPAATLAVHDVTAAFGGVVALDAVSFEVEPGEVVGLIGPNGAGKTTLLDVVTGYTPAASGSTSFGGDRIDGWSVERRARAGIVRSWQAVELFEELTVRDNLL